MSCRSAREVSDSKAMTRSPDGDRSNRTPLADDGDLRPFLVLSRVVVGGGRRRHRERIGGNALRRTPYTAAATMAAVFLV